MLVDADDDAFRPKPPPLPLFPYFGLAPNADLLLLLLPDGGLDALLLALLPPPKFLVSMFVFFPAFLSNVTWPLAPLREFIGTLSKPPMVYFGPSSFLFVVVSFFVEALPKPSSE